MSPTPATPPGARAAAGDGRPTPGAAARASRPGVDVAALHGRILDAVGDVAAVDPAPTDPFRGLYLRDEQAVTLAGGTPVADVTDRLAAVGDALGLDALGRAVLLAVCLPELDARYLRLYGYLHDDLQRRWPSARLLGRLLVDDGEAAVWERVGAASALRRCGAIVEEPDDGHWPLLDRGLRPTGPVAAALLGIGRDGSASEYPAPAAQRASVAPAAAVVDRMRAALYATRGAVLLARGADARAVVGAAAGSEPVLLETADLHDVARRAPRLAAACLTGAPLAVVCAGRPEPAACRMIEKHLTGLPVPVVLLADDLPADHEALAVLEIDVPGPDRHEREALWHAAGAAALSAELASAFRLTRGQLRHAGRAAAVRAAAEGEAPDWRGAARRVSRAGLAELAEPVRTDLSLAELVLAERPRRMLEQVATHLRHRDVALDDWGMRRVAPSPGMKLLFAGESGTGKTLAAAALARGLGLDAFRIDLATVVSKYIGETEKNLDRVFAAAGGSNAVLFFDEADAIFGKRSAVSSSHDRYANLEVAYLLQRMEHHDGAVVLATNLRRNIDDAFLRRLDLVVDFPMPEPNEREALWRLHLPRAVPLAADVDLGALARGHRLSGGNIRNCALAACVQAVADGGEVHARHFDDAVNDEYVKLGRLVPPSAPTRSRELAA